MNLIANLGGQLGDARFAIELLRRAGKIADLNNTKKIQLKHVNEAVQSIHPIVQSDILKDLSLHHLLFLLAVSQNLIKNENQDVSIKDTEAIYHEICRRFKKRPRKHTQVWQYVQDLCTYEILCTNVISQGIRGRTTFVNLLEFSPKILEREIMPILSFRLLD